MKLILDFATEHKHILHVNIDLIHLLVNRQETSTMKALVKGMV